MEIYKLTSIYTLTLLKLQILLFTLHYNCNLDYIIINDYLVNNQDKLQMYLES